jgi:glycosyltransferase involved in cell wall biosynthesis
MRILIDAHMVGERETGNEAYVVGLLNALANGVAENDTIMAAVAHPEYAAERLKLRPPHLILPVSRSSALRLVRDLPGLARRYRADILHVTYAGPITAPCPVVVTVHDVSFRRNPCWFSFRDRLVLNVGVEHTLRIAKAVLTISEHSKAEICRYYRIPANNVQVTHLAHDPMFTAVHSDRDRSSIPAAWDPYVLTVGNLQPRKNLVRLIESFSRFVAPRFPHKLVIAGKSVLGGAEIRKALRDTKQADRFLLPGYIAQDSLPALYRKADLFVFPSLYEGFGLPLIEAMACGTPVLTSNAASLPEVAGDAAIMFNPCDTAAIGNALGRVLGDGQLRRELRARGLARSACFSWQRTAAETLAVYRAIAGKAHA